MKTNKNSQVSGSVLDTLSIKIRYSVLLLLFTGEGFSIKALGWSSDMTTGLLTQLPMGRKRKIGSIIPIIILALNIII